MTNAPAWQEPAFDTVRFDGARRCLLIALTFLLPVSQILTVGGKLVNFSFADLVLPLAMLWLMWNMLTRGGLRVPAPMVFFFSLGMVCLSTFLNLERALLHKGATSQIIEFAKLLSLWIYFYVMANLLAAREDFLVMLKTWVLSSGLVATLGAVGSLLYQKAGIETVFSLQFRAQGTFDDANLFAAHCGASLMLALLYMKLSGARWPLFIAALHLAGLVFSASRGSLMSVGLALAALGFLFSPLRVKLGIAFALFMGVLGFLALPGRDEALRDNPVLGRLTTATVDLNNPEAQQRRELWEVALRTWQANPWFGVGKGNYGMGEGGEAGLIGVAHSTYLGLLAETGAIGFFAFALAAGVMVGPVAWMALKGDLAAGTLMASLLVIMLAGVTISIENYRGLWALMAVFEAYRRLWVDPLTPRDRRGRMVSLAA